ncbi:restriction endonuclease subunit S [Shewanella baltica]|uniref:restriction endonuclease subunit S n=1 Tax=Shewanella baltica TaxID=62322 RepID=UPI0039AEFA29
MSALIPEGWTKVVAADAFSLIATTDKKVKTKEYLTFGNFPVIDQGQGHIAGYINDKSKVITVDEPLIVFGDHTRAVKWIDFNFVPGADGTKILQSQSFIDSRLAYHQLCSLEIPDKGYSRHFKFFKELSFVIPPLAEQKVIADKLDELLAQVESAKARLDAIPAILKSFRQSVLAAAVSGKLTEEWRQNNTSFVASLSEIQAYWAKHYQILGKRFKNADVSPIQDIPMEIPDNWIWSQIGLVFDVYVGATPSRKEERYWGGDINWVSSSEVAFCRISETKETITNEGLNCTSTNVHPKGTVMLAMIGQGKTRGQPAILDIDACHNQNTAAIRIPEKYCISEYLYYFLYERYEETRRVGSGNNQQAMNKSVVQSLSFPLPPYEEQVQIVRRVEELFTFADKVEAQVNAAQARVNNLTQAILAKAFRGELTADWRAANPDLISGENSAEALLKRIKAERAKLKPVKKTTAKKAKA